MLPVRQRGGCCQPLAVLDHARAEETAEVLKALGEPTRLSMVAALWRAEEPVCICDFTAAFDLSQPTISHHMGKLKSAGLVESTKQGIWIYYQLRDDLAPATRALLHAVLDAVLGQAESAARTSEASRPL
jgi:ArsR family transcriptional regulator, arsenate/arsenite/antimonite-responsive transcriptional repressor